MLLAVALMPWAALSRDEHEAISTTRDAMCRGVVREMHTEIHKHSLRKNGEDDIYETVPAICLAIVQNYTLTKTAAPSSSWALLKRATKLDDEEGGMPDPETFKHIMTLKKAHCALALAVALALALALMASAGIRVLRWHRLGPATGHRGPPQAHYLAFLALPER